MKKSDMLADYAGDLAGEAFVTIEDAMSAAGGVALLCGIGMLFFKPDYRAALVFAASAFFAALGASQDGFLSGADLRIALTFAAATFVVVGGLIFAFGNPFSSRARRGSQQPARSDQP